jgi:hypothetical protein
MLLILQGEHSRAERRMKRSSRARGETGHRGRAAELLVIVLTLICGLLPSHAQEREGPETERRSVSIKGQVSDPSGNLLPQVAVQLVAGERVLARAVSGPDGQFQLRTASAGQFTIKAEAAGFRPVSLPVVLPPANHAPIELRMTELASRDYSITVTADVNAGDVLSPDAAMKVYASEDLLDANPGRPGAPISIPGYPVETASSGIKAPQYFAPGVAGDHGEPIAMFIQVGSYLVPNNLSANAHGNGYTDPNIFIANGIESVQVDGGAFNVREGNHALNLAAIYGLRQHLEPFLTLTGDDRDIAATAGMSPSQNSWVAMEGSVGNGFLDRLEHRKQFKFNGGRVFHAGDHTLTLFGLGYVGYGYLAGLKPIYGFNSVDAAAGWKVDNRDTIDPRQKDQTHTALVALNDVWKLDERQELQFSGFFRTYNLALFSDFGLGLIRQSEFRTVTGSSLGYVNKITKTFTLLAGMDYEREAPRRDDLDHYNFYNPAMPDYYGPFVKIIGSNVTIAPLAPYVAGQGQLTKYLRYYLGWRRDAVHMDNQDLVTPANSWSKWVGVNSPKATLTFLPGESRYAPLISASFGKSFFTEDPRAGAEFNGPTSMLPVEQARSYQLVTSKTFRKTDVKLTLGHETQNAEYGKIDSDQGLMFPLGPGRIRYLAATVRQSFTSGSLQATFEQADARLTNTYPTTGVPGDSFSIIPEAPRLIGDISGTYDKLPFHLRMKAEFEYVGRKVVGDGCNESAYLSGDPNALNYYCLGVSNKEFRLSVVRPFFEKRIDVGVNMMIASGYTGQTTENFGAAGYYSPGAVAVDPNTKLVPANPVNEVVGVRIPSYASLNVTYRFGGAR